MVEPPAHFFVCSLELNVLKVVSKLLPVHLGFITMAISLHPSRQLEIVICVSYNLSFLGEIFPLFFLVPAEMMDTSQLRTKLIDSKMQIIFFCLVLV